MVGIVGYGTYIPKYRIKSEEISHVWSRDPNSVKKGLLIDEKSVPAIDEDTATISIEASMNALKRAEIDPKKIGAIYCGTEESAYAVKPNITTIGAAIGAGPEYTGADMEFACKAGTASIQAALGLVKSNLIEYGLAIGADIAKFSMENIGEQSTGAGAAAFILGNKKEEVIAEIEGTHSFSSDTPDFWRRQNQISPRHAERFTGGPAYFHHSINATKGLMTKLGLIVSDFDHIVFHSPNGKFVLKIAKALGFEKDKLKHSFVVDKIANTYSAASLISLCNVLDNAKPEERILVTSFGSGAGSDSFSIKVTDNIKGKPELAKTTQMYLSDKEYVDFGHYLKYTRRLG